jgi:heterodisulfide reductase subunit B
MATEKTFAFFLGCIMPNRYPQIEKATRFVMDKLGYTIKDMERASCCPAPGVFRSFDKYDWMVAAARNICIAEKMDTDILTVCNGCFGTLQEVNTHLKNDEVAKAKVNEKLKLLGDYEYKGTIEVRHIAEVLGFEIGPTAIQEYLVRKVHAKAAIHYGCHFLKPSKTRNIQSPEAPTILEDFVEALGVVSLDFKNKHTCCGAGGGVKAAHPDASMTILGEKMKNIADVEPDFIFDVCPFCHLQFDSGQDWLNKNRSQHFDIPVIHISQLTAYCMGMDSKYLGFNYQTVGKSFFFKSAEEEKETVKMEEEA